MFCSKTFFFKYMKLNVSVYLRYRGKKSASHVLCGEIDGSTSHLFYLMLGILEEFQQLTVNYPVELKLQYYL